MIEFGQMMVDFGRYQRMIEFRQTAIAFGQSMVKFRQVIVWSGVD